MSLLSFSDTMLKLGLSYRETMVGGLPIIEFLKFGPFGPSGVLHLVQDEFGALFDSIADGICFQKGLVYHPRPYLERGLYSREQLAHLLGLHASCDDAQLERALLARCDPLVDYGHCCHSPLADASSFVVTFSNLSTLKSQYPLGMRLDDVYYVDFMNKRFVNHFVSHMLAGSLPFLPMEWGSVLDCMFPTEEFKVDCKSFHKGLRKNKSVYGSVKAALPEEPLPMQKFYNEFCRRARLAPGDYGGPFHLYRLRGCLQFLGLHLVRRVEDNHHREAITEPSQSSAAVAQESFDVTETAKLEHVGVLDGPASPDGCLERANSPKKHKCSREPFTLREEGISLLPQEDEGIAVDVTQNTATSDLPTGVVECSF